jgi:hypothetical protein
MSVGENVVNPVPLITSPESFFQKYNWKKRFQKIKGTKTLRVRDGFGQFAAWNRKSFITTQGEFSN